MGIAALVSQPLDPLGEHRLFGFRQLPGAWTLVWRGAACRRGMDADHLVPVGESQLGRDPGAPVAPLGGEPLVAKILRHEFGPQIADGENTQATFIGGV